MNTAHTPAGFSLIPGWIRHGFETFPSRVALSYQDHDGGARRSFTYRELDRASAAVATWIAGQPRKCAVGIFCRKTIDAYAAVLGTFASGACLVPLSPAWPVERPAKVMDGARVDCLVVDRKSLADAEAASLLRVPYLVIDFENDPPAAVTPLPPAGVPSSSAAYAMCTSGTTGAPKIITVSHGNLAAFMENIRRIVPLRDGDRVSQLFDLGFDPALAELLHSLMAGATLCPLDATRIVSLGSYLNREGVTVLNTSPSAVRVLAQASLLKDGLFPGVRETTFVGEPLTSALAQAWRRAAPRSAITNLYGPTETTVTISSFRWEKDEPPPASACLPIGTVHPDHRFLVVDEKLEPVEAGQSGELLLAGPQVSELAAKEASHAGLVTFPRFPGLRWYRTGDLVRQEGKLLHFLCRRDWQLKIQGRRVEAEEIESVLCEAGKFPWTVVLPWHAEKGEGAQGTVAVIPLEERGADFPALLERARRRLAASVLPRQFLGLEQLPLSPSGKLDRGDVARRWKEGSLEPLWNSQT